METKPLVRPARRIISWFASAQRGGSSGSTDATPVVISISAPSAGVEQFPHRCSLIAGLVINADELAAEFLDFAGTDGSEGVATLSWQTIAIGERPALADPLFMASVTVGFYGERLLSVVACPAGPAVLHVSHGCQILHFRLPEYFVMAVGAFLPGLHNMKFVAVNNVGGPLYGELDVTSAHLAPCRGRHEQTCCNNSNKCFFHVPPLFPKLIARPCKDDFFQSRRSSAVCERVGFTEHLRIRSPRCDLNIIANHGQAQVRCNGITGSKVKDCGD